MGLLLDVTPEGPDDLPEPPDVETNGGPPGQFEMLARGLLGVPRYPLRALRSLPRALPNVEDTPFGALPGATAVGRLTRRTTGLLGNRAAPVRPRSLRPPKTSFNGRISPHRRVVFGQMSLEEVKEVKNLYGATVNDVVVSICAGAVRAWLIEHGELPDEPLVAQIPVSVRTEEQAGTYGNRILLMAAPLRTDVEDPVERLRLTHESMADMKE